MPAETQAPQPARMHDMDGLRSVLMLLVCVGHALLIYTMGLDWFIASPDESAFLMPFAALLTVFHMPAFFLLAGFFSAKSLGRKPVAGWLGARVQRLLLPFLTAAVTLSPLAILAATIAAGGPKPGPVSEFGTDFLTNLGVFDRRWIGHLWFLPTLFVFSALTALLAATRVLEPLARAFGRVLAQQPGRLVWLVMVTLSALWTVGVIGGLMVAETRLGYRPLLGGLIDLRAWGVHLPFFLLGIVFAHSGAAMTALTRVTPLRLALTGVAAIAYVIVWVQDDFAGRVVKTVLEGLLSLALTFLALRLARAVFRQPSRIMRTLSEQSLSVYLVHYPLVALLGVMFQTIAWPPELEFVIVMSAMLAGSFALAALIQNVAILRFLYNGVPMGAPAPRARAANA